MRGLERGRRLVSLLIGILLGLTACSSATPPSGVAPPAVPTEPAPATAPSDPVGQTGPLAAPGASQPASRRPAPTRGAPPPPPASTAPAGTLVEVAYRLERRTTDPATADFVAFAESTLADPRGWRRAGFGLVRQEDARFTVVLAEGPEVDAMCLPYDTYGQYSCQNGPTVALNADRWRSATPKWTGTLDDYRRYLVGHEVGHLLGLRHPRIQCPAPGRPAPLMAQQSTELEGCLPNPWPLDDEVGLGRRRPADLAPPYQP